MLYWVHLAMNRVRLTALVVIGTDCTGSCKSNYHTITTTTAPYGDLLFTLSILIVDRFHCLSVLYSPLWWFVIYPVYFDCWQISLSICLVFQCFPLSIQICYSYNINISNLIIGISYQFILLDHSHWHDCITFYPRMSIKVVEQCIVNLRRQSQLNLPFFKCFICLQQQK